MTDDARAALADALPTTEAEWAPFWHRVDDPDGWVVSIRGEALAEYTLGRLPDWRLVPVDAVPVDAERLARLEMALDLIARLPENAPAAVRVSARNVARSALAPAPSVPQEAGDD